MRNVRVALFFPVTVCQEFLHCETVAASVDTLHAICFCMMLPDIHVELYLSSLPCCNVQFVCSELFPLLQLVWLLDVLVTTVETLRGNGLLYNKCSCLVGEWGSMFGVWMRS